MAFVPLHDENPLRVIRLQVVTAAIIMANVVIFLVFGGISGEAAVFEADLSFGVVPSELLDFGKSVAVSTAQIPEGFTLVTYMFFHAGWLHLLSNMAFLWVFGDNIEDAFGHAGFLFFYLICGIAGALAHVAFYPQSMEPLVGASGAISGVIASYLALFPRARILVLAYVLPVRLPAWFALGGWIALQVASLWNTSEGASSVAWWTHLGGFAVGLLLTIALRPKLRVN